MFSHCKTHDELKKAYRRESLKHHPDKGGNADDFLEVNRQMAKRKRELDKPPRPKVQLPPEVVELLERDGEKMVDLLTDSLRRNMLDLLTNILRKTNARR
jgi:hypothetical protein